MAVSVRERAPEKARTDVRIVDCDVHPTPRAGEWIEYVPEPYRSEFWKKRQPGDNIYYDAPDYAHAMAMRLDSFPTDGNFAGSDPEMAFQHVIMQAGCDIAVLEPFSLTQYIPEHTLAGRIATNHWLANHWLDAKNNWHERWRGSILRRHRGPDRLGSGDRALGGPPAHVTGPSDGGAAAVLGGPAL